MTVEEWRNNFDSSVVHGIKTMACTSLTDLQSLASSRELSGFVFRGQMDARWPVRSSFDRFINHPEFPNRKDRDRHESLLWEHCKRFGTIVKAAGILPMDVDYHEFASVGQHYGLATNFIDWTFSFHHSLFFAFSEPSVSDINRVIWCFKTTGNSHHFGTVMQTLRGAEREISLVRFLTPSDQNNLRMSCQRGLFCRVCGGGSLDAILFDAMLDPGQALRIVMPTALRNEVLSWLKQSGVTASQVFPDLTGAATYVNSLLREDLLETQ